MSVPVIKGATGLDVVAAIPYCLGYQPAASLVGVALMPPRGRLGATWRADSEGLRDPEAGPDLAHNLAAVMVQQDAQGVFLVRYATADEPSADQDKGLRLALAALRQTCPVEALWDYWGGILRELDPRTLQPIGDVHAPDELKGTRVMASHAALGTPPPMRCRAALAEFPEVDKEAQRRAARAERRAIDRFAASDDAARVGWRLKSLKLWRTWLNRLAAAPSAPVDPVVLGKLGAALHDQPTRDAVIAAQMRRSRTWPERLAKGLIGCPPVLDPLESDGFEPRYGDASDALFRQVIAHQAPKRRAAALGTFATVKWWRGDGSAAGELAEAALDCPNPPAIAALALASVQALIFPQTLKAKAAAARRSVARAA
ncbi:MAG: DUF4192 domain-containing protein [Bifidobacteriaceae bacterium]|jgi:hypothetical protein|nr:DUF4192 domain-containing protein [Bifidobacteriaceae bacterium]